MNSITNEIKRLRYFIRQKAYIKPESRKEIINQFHKLYYDSYAFGGTWINTFWMGIPTSKCPLDMWIYQEIISSIKPDLIIETGTFNGGSALYLASICDIIKKGKVISIDIEKRKNRPIHPRIKYLLGSSTSESIVEQIKKTINQKDKVLIILDSDHSKKHVLNELNIYKGLVTKGSYIIVEDTNVNGHPIAIEHGPGPMEAIYEFLRNNKNFVIDKSMEKFYMTFNPNGYLKKLTNS